MPFHVELRHSFRQARAFNLDAEKLRRTVVAPEADLKVFLTASPAERARRRHRELSTSGVRVSYASLKRDQSRRDSLDSTRAASPLVPAEDAVIVDSTGKTARQVVQEIVRLARAPKPGGKPRSIRRRPRAGRP